MEHWDTVAFMGAVKVSSPKLNSISASNSPNSVGISVIEFPLSL